MYVFGIKIKAIKEFQKVLKQICFRSLESITQYGQSQS